MGCVVLLFIVIFTKVSKVTSLHCSDQQLPASSAQQKNMNFPFMCYTGEAHIVIFFLTHLCTVHKCSEVANIYVLLEEMC